MPWGNPTVLTVLRIIAVSDLNSFAYDSWAANAGTDGQCKMWLRHFLADDLPGFRTMVYGYDSSLSKESRGIHRIPDYADRWMHGLKKVRTSAEASVVFVCVRGSLRDVGEETAVGVYWA